MTKLLHVAVATLLKLSEEKQDEIARRLLEVAAEEQHPSMELES